MPVKIENSRDLIFWTYHMLDWNRVKQSSSNQICVQCGGIMLKAGPVVDARGSKYDGLVCHLCKRVIWLRAD